MAALNPLTEWFGLPPSDQPIDYYGLLGLPRYAAERALIEERFLARRKQLEPHLAGKSKATAAGLLRKLEEAKSCLLNPIRKAEYDQRLRSLDKAPAEEPAEASSNEYLPQLSSADELSAAEEFPSLEEPLPAPLARTEALPASQPVATSAPSEPKPASPAPTNRRLWLAIGAGSLALFVLGAGFGSLTTWWLSSSPAEVVQAPAQPTLLPPAPSITAAVPAGAAAIVNSAPAPAIHENASQSQGPAAPVPMVSVAPPAAETGAAASTAPAATTVPAAATVANAATPAVAETTPTEPQATADMPAEPASEPEAEPEPTEFAVAAAIPPPPPACTSDDERAKYLEHVRAMIEAGLGKVRNREKARQHYEQAKSLCTSDPRLYYAYALSLHTIDRDEAKAQLLLAMKDGAYAYPPAWRLLIDMELKKPLEPRIVTGLANFARRVEQSVGPWPGEADKAEFAMYLGRVVGFCRGPSAEAQKFNADIESADNALLAILADSRKRAYELGKTEVLSVYGLRQEQAYQQADQATQAAQSEKSEAQQKVVAKQQELTDNEQKLARTKEEYDQKWEKLKAEFQRDWATFEADFKIVMEQGQQIENSLERIESQINYWQGRMNLAFMQRAQSKGASGTSPVEIQAQNMIQQLSVERAFLRVQISEQERKAQGIQLKGNARLAEIIRAEAEYQRATGQLVKESSLIADKRKTLTTQADKLAKRRPEKAGRATSPAELRRLSTYAPLDLEAEKRRILDSYAGL